jgi:hypothetical protein
LDRLLHQLAADGALDAGGVAWARAHRAEHGGELDSALLELDLVSEPTLLKALGSAGGMTAATPADLLDVDPEVGKRLPLSFSRSFLLCPVRSAGKHLVALVQSPLPAEWVQDLRDLFGLELEQRVSPSHYLELGRAKVYGSALDQRMQELEARLARRRGAPDVSRVVELLGQARTLPEAVTALLDFAANFLEWSSFLVPRSSGLEVIESSSRRPVALPDPACTLAPALLHGGYFLGPVGGNPEDQRFYAALERPLPRWAFVAAVPARAGARAMLCADNGARGIAVQWAAELTWLVARLGRWGRAWVLPWPEEAATVTARAPNEPALAVSDQSPAVAGPAGVMSLDARERAAIERLRQAAADAGLPFDELVDDLLRQHRPDSAAAASAMMAEVKGLFERLATDIPTQLARGMESAFRDLVPRVGTGPGRVESPPVSAGVDLVQKPAAQREVASYQSRRGKSTRIKL